MFKNIIMDIIVFALILAIIMGFASCTVIKSGDVGILSRMGAVQDQALNAGLHFKTPFVDSVRKMSVQTQKIEVDASAASKDLQTILATVAVNLRVNPDSATALYKNVGTAYGVTVVIPSVQESVKSVVARFSAEQCITRRQDVSVSIKEELSEKLIKYGIVIDDLNITNFDFSAEFNAAIEAKQTAQQQALKAEQDLTRIEVEAKQKIAMAQADAESIKARADAEAYSIRAIQDQLAKDDNYIEYQKIEKWDGKLPVVQGDSSPIIDFRSGSEKQPFVSH